MSDLSQENLQRRYLIVGPSWIGDMVMAQSLLITLKQQYPDCIIDVLAPAWSLPVLQRMPEVRKGLAVDVAHGELAFFKRRRFGRQLRAQAYTHAIVIPRSWKSALIPYFARVPVRTGYRGEMRYGLLNDIRKLDKQLLSQTVQRYVAHAYDAGSQQVPVIPTPALNVDTGNQEKLQTDLLKKMSIDLALPVVCFMPGAEYGPAKQWPLDYYRQLAEKLVESGYQVWVLGSEKDIAAGDVIAGHTLAGQEKINTDPAVFNLCGKTQLVDTVDLLAMAGAVVSNDSGLMHVAAAVGADVHVIYGSSTPDYTPPLTSRSTIYYLGLECSPCFQRTCPLGHTNCLNKIKYEDVYRNITR